MPAFWWLMVAGFSASLWLAYQHAYGPSVSIPIALGAALVLGAALIAYGRARIAVEPSGLIAGRATLPFWAIGEVEPLDAQAARAQRGRDADPQAFFLLRAYAPQAVRIEVTDPADPVPYWLISTRRPQEFAAAIEAARTETPP